MNGFLVELVHLMDDLPIGLYSTREQAIQIAENTKPMPTNRIREIFLTNTSTPISVKITEFKDGIPISREIIKSFDNFKKYSLDYTLHASKQSKQQRIRR